MSNNIFKDFHKLSAQKKEEAEKYDVKIDRPKDMSYEFNLLELAHPDSYVITKTYDPINGLVENNNQQNKIIRKLLENPLHSQMLNYKLASEGLVYELSKVAELYPEEHFNQKLVHHAASDVYSGFQKSIPTSMKKEALVGALVGVGLGLLGVWYLANHMPNATESVNTNGQQAIAQLQKITRSEDGAHSHTFSESLKNRAGQCIRVVETLMDKFQSVDEKINELKEKFESYEEDKGGLIKDIRNNPETKKIFEEFTKQQNEFINYLNKMTPRLQRFQADLSSQVYQKSQIQNADTLDSINQFFGNALEGGWGFLHNSLDGAANALLAFNQVCKSTIELYARSYESLKQDMGRVATPAPSTGDELAEPATTTPTPTASQSLSPSQPSANPAQELVKKWRK